MAASRGGRPEFVRTALLAGLLMMALPAIAGATTPTLMWTGARNIAVHCLVQSSMSRSPIEFERLLCDRVRTVTSARSRLPVRIVEAGDPAFISSDTVLLLVHASVEPMAEGRMIAFAIRPYRPSGGDAEVYFGAAPKALLARGVSIGPALDKQIRAAVGEILLSQIPAAGNARPL